MKHANSTWIQGFGECLGKPAGELNVGDVLGWNAGHTSTVVDVINETAKTITFQTEWIDYTGKPQLYERKFLKTRIVAIVKNGKFDVLH